MSFLQKQNFMIKLLLFLIMGGVIGIVLSILLGIIATPSGEEIDDWVFAAGFIGSFILLGITFISSEHNALQKLYSHAEASNSDRKAIQLRTDNLMLELNMLLNNQLEHEKRIYLNVGKEIIKETSHKVGANRTIEEIKHEMRQYPTLGSNEQFMKLFSQTARCHEDLLIKTMTYNRLASEYNSGIASFPAKFFRKRWKLEPMEYFKQE